MNLKIRNTEVKVVDYDDLETFITEAYGLTSRFEYLDLEEPSNDSCKTFSVTKKPLKPYQEQAIAAFKADPLSEMYITHALLMDLCNKGWLDPGEYLVVVSW